MLSFGDSLLVQDDIQLFSDRNWLNDKVIDFAYEYMTETILSTSALKEDVLLCCTGVAQLLKVLPGVCLRLQPTHLNLQILLIDKASDIPAVVSDLNITSRKWIFCPVNDSTSLESIGGTHWSLLVVDVARSGFYHFDSLDHYNISAAHIIKDKLSAALCASGSNPVIECTSPKQRNGYDCGMYVIEMSRKLLQSIIQNKAAADCEMSELTPDLIRQARLDWLQIVNKLLSEQKGQG